MSQQSPGPLRVLHVLRSAGLGGIEKLTAQLVKLQSEDPEIQPDVLFLMRKDGDLRELFGTDGVEVEELALSSGFDFTLKKLRKARQLMSRYDVLHLHTFHPFAARAAKLTGRAVLFTEHGNFGFGRKRTLADHVKSKMLSWFLNRNVQYVSFNSRFTESVSIRRYGLESVQKSVVHNGIDLSRQTVSEIIPSGICDKLENKFVVGTSTRFAGFKRIDRLVDGFAQFSKRIDNVVLLLVGDGDKRAELEEQVSALGISGKVVFAGYQVNVTAFQRLMDVCVFPSKSEPFGLVALEAYAIGKPVVVFQDGGGILEIVEEFDSRDVVRDADGLAERLEYYFQKEEGAGESAARVNYVKRFDLHNATSDFKDIYRLIAKCAE